jgi:hemolysin activation/secretion protein
MGKTLNLMRKKYYSLAMFILLVSFGHSQTPSNFGQGFDQIAPKTLPRNDAPQAESPEGELPEASGDETIVTEKLRGIVFVGSPELVKVDGISEPTELLGTDKIKIVGFTPPDVAGFRAIAAARIGKPASLYSANELMRDLILHFRKNKRPVVDIFLAEQSMQNSVVQIVVVEGRLGQVRTEGNKFFPSPLLTAAIRTESKGEIDAGRMARDVSWLNNNPFRQVDLVYAKGEELGFTDVVLKTSDRFPFRGYVGFDDTGNDLTEDERVSFGFNWGNVGGWDHQFNYQHISDLGFTTLRAHSASYLVPLPWRHTLTVFGSYGATDAEFAASDGVQNSEGYSWQTSMRYNVPIMDIELGEKQKYKHEVVFGYDFKEGNSQLFTTGATGNTDSQTSQFMIGYNASLPDAYGSTTFTSSVFYSPGGWTSSNADQEFRSLTNTGDGSTYVYSRLTLDRVTKLPWDFTWMVRGLVQFSDSNLSGGEQLGAGGYATVRGYDEREANGDEGYLLSNEIRTPSLTPGKWLGLEKASDQLQFLGFVDYGATNTKDPNPAGVNAPGPNTTLMSVGPGFRYSISPYLTARFDYGWQLYDSQVGAASRRDYDSRGHFSIVLSY